MRAYLFLSIFLLLLAPIALAQPPFAPALPPPAGARVSLVPEKTTWFLGENILVHFVVTNAGDVPFSLTEGGDYRGDWRARRFHVEAKDEAGQSVVDPHPTGFGMGGIVGLATLKPGETFAHTIPLVRYLRFEKPGTYVIRAWHDLGWKATPEYPLPVAQTTITLVMPTPDQARAVVAEMERLPTGTSSSFGEKIVPYQDFGSLGYPVYLPLLFERAQAGVVKALDGIEPLDTFETTRSLLDLLQNDHKEIVQRAADILAMRLPTPPNPPRVLRWRATLDAASTAELEQQDQARRDLTRRTWKSEFAIPLRAFARRRLASAEASPAEPNALRNGALILMNIGTSDDWPTLLHALGARLAQTAHHPVFSANQLEADTANWQVQDDCDVLLRAGIALVQREGNKIQWPTMPQEANEIALFLTRLKLDETFHPAQGQSLATRWATHPLPYVRTLALQALQMGGGAVRPDGQPQNDGTWTIPTPVLQRLPELLTGADGGVQMEACYIISHSPTAQRDPRLKAPLLKLIRTARSHWILDAAKGAVKSLNLEPVAWDIWAGRLDENGMTPQALVALSGVAGREVSGYRTDVKLETGQTLKPKWQAFLKAHRAFLESGKRLDRTAAELKSLLPEGFSYS